MNWTDEQVFSKNKEGILLRLLFKKDPHSATRIIKKVQLPFEKFNIKYTDDMDGKDTEENTEFAAFYANLEVSEDSKYLGIYSQLRPREMIFD